MPKILGVHGIANTYLTAPQLTSAWFDAVQGGIEEAGYPGIAPEDLTVVAYGSLFRPDGTRGTRDRVDIEADWEKGLLESWWRAAAQLSSESRALRGKDDSATEQVALLQSNRTIYSDFGIAPSAFVPFRCGVQGSDFEEIRG